MRLVTATEGDTMREAAHDREPDSRPIRWSDLAQLIHIGPVVTHRVARVGMIVVLAIGGLPPQRLGAQLAEIPVLDLTRLLDRNYAFRLNRGQSESSPTFEPAEKDLMLEAQIAPHFPFWLRTPPASCYPQGERAQCLTMRTGWRLGLVATPKVVIRVFNDVSDPARSPSYMPKISLLALRNVPSESPDGAPPLRFRFFAAAATLGHHSNGQAGCLFSSGRVAAESCSGPDTTTVIGPTPGEPLNLESGSFSTNFLQLTGQVGDAPAPYNYSDFFAWRLAVSLEWHLGRFFCCGGGISPWLRERYGRARAAVEGELTFNLFDRGGRAGPVSWPPSWSPSDWIALPAFTIRASYERYDRAAGRRGAGYWFIELGPSIGRQRRIELVYRVQGGRDYYNMSFERAIVNSLVGVIVRQPLFL